MFEVNDLRKKCNKRSAAPLMSSIVLKSIMKSCFDGVVFQDAVTLYLCFIFASQGTSLHFTAVKIVKMSQETKKFFKADFFRVSIVNFEHVIVGWVIR